MAENLVPIEYEADPERCPSVTSLGQCRFKVLPGRKTCSIHVGSSSLVSSGESKRNYRIAKWQARMEEFADNPQLKSLREEIGLLRILLEEVINSCTDKDKLIINSNKIADLVTRIEKLVKSCHSLEKSTGTLLDKAAASQLMGRVLTIITNYIEDKEIIGRIADEIVKAIKDAQPSAE